jgi:hypothetical protein
MRKHHGVAVVGGAGALRGFASVFAFALAIMVLAAAAALAVQLGGDKNAAVAALEAGNVGWRFGDGQKLAELTATDVVVDSAYTTCGCGRTGSNAFLALAREKAAKYFENASAVLSDGVYSASFSGVGVEGTVSDSTCNLEGNLVVSVKEEVKSPNAVRRETLSINRKLSVRKTEALVRIDVSGDSGKLAGIEVACE